jgi:hypothetical protein
MKKTTLLFLFISAIGFSQALQKQAPWMQSPEIKNNLNIDLNEVETAARAYFQTIDKDKKGSGLKPFERWNYHWSHYTNQDGTMSTAKDLWNAWEQKNEMNTTAARADNSNWISLGPYSHTNTASWSAGQGRVNTIAVDPSNANTYYIGAPAGGIWKSVDAGVNWTPLTDYLPQIGVSGIAIHPTNSDIIYIATGDDDANDSFSVGVWKSIDGGTTWKATAAMEGNPNSMNEIYIDSNNPDTILIATNTGVHKTTNGGASWTRKLDANIIDLKMKPGDATTWYAASGTTVYGSTDSGETFDVAIVVPDSSRIVLEVTPANSDYVYFVSADGSNAFNRVYKSTTPGMLFFGKTAETNDIFGSTQAWYDLALTVSDTDPDIMYVGVLNVWKSTDGGNNFSQMNNWSSPNAANYTHADIHLLRFINGSFFACTDGGIYKSTDHGDNFTDLTENLAISQFYRISVSQQESGNIVGGLQDNGGYAYNEGNWNNFYGADGMDGAVSATTPDTYYGFIQNGANLYKTEDGGLSVSSSYGSPSGESGLWVTPMVSNATGQIFAGYNNLYRLDETAGEWVDVSPGYNFGGRLAQIEFDPNDNDNVYASRGNTLHRGKGGNPIGVIFSEIPAFADGTINAIEISNSNSNIAWVTTNNSVWKSTNMLADSPSFTNITSNLPSETKWVIRHHAGSANNTVYLGTSLGVYYIDDTTTDWEIFDNNLPNVAVRDLEINEIDEKLFAATYGRGVFVADISAAALAVDNFAFSNSISIYPNPSVDNFIIQSPELKTMDIQLFNITGKSILIKKDIIAINGSYSLNMAAYAKGLYFLKISADGKQTTRKIVLK